MHPTRIELQRNYVKIIMNGGYKACLSVKFEIMFVALTIKTWIK